MDNLKSAIENDLETIINELNDVSQDFENEFDLTDFEDRDPANSFYDFADSYTPLYYSEVEAECDDEILDDYLSEIGSVTISDSSDINKLKQAALCIDYERQLFEDETDIMFALFYRAILDEIESFEGLEFGRVADAIDECVTKKEYSLSAIKALLDVE